MRRRVRPASETAGLINEMRQLVQAPAGAPQEDRAELERSVTARIATILMVLLVMVIFITSAVPDVGPSLARVIEAHL